MRPRAKNGGFQLVYIYRFRIKSPNTFQNRSSLSLFLSSPFYMHAAACLLAIAYGVHAESSYGTFLLFTLIPREQTQEQKTMKMLSKRTLSRNGSIFIHLKNYDCCVFLFLGRHRQKHSNLLFNFSPPVCLPFISLFAYILENIINCFVK